MGKRAQNLVTQRDQQNHCRDKTFPLYVIIFAAC